MSARGVFGASLALITLLRLCGRRQCIISVNAGQHKHERVKLLCIGQGQLAKTKYRG